MSITGDNRAVAADEGAAVVGKALRRSITAQPDRHDALEKCQNSVVVIYRHTVRLGTWPLQI